MYIIYHYCGLYILKGYRIYSFYLKKVATQPVSSERNHQLAPPDDFSRTRIKQSLVATF